MRLYKFASCNPELFPYKLAYFKLLRMLQRMRPCILDRTLRRKLSVALFLLRGAPFLTTFLSTLSGRINRLLLPLFTNLRTPASEELAEFSQAPLTVSRPSGTRPPPLHTSSTLTPHAQTSSNAVRLRATTADYRTMPRESCFKTFIDTASLPHRSTGPLTLRAKRLSRPTANVSYCTSRITGRTRLAPTTCLR